MTGKAAGTATITVSASGAASKTCTVTVSTVGLTISTSSASLVIGGTLQLTATTTPSGRTVTWTSSNTGVATVSSSGLVTGKAAGTATITVSASGAVSKTCTVTVGSRSLSITASKYYQDYTGNLQLGISASQPSGTTYTWSSSDDSVATVYQSGMLYFHKIGSVQITLKASTGDTVTQTFYGVLPDGMYNLEAAGSHLYATVDRLKVFQTSGAYQYTGASTNPTQVWKIKYLGDGQYSIRTYMNDRMGLAVLGTGSNEVGIVSIGTTNTINAVTSAARWIITTDSAGLTIKNVSSGKALATPYGSTALYDGLLTSDYISGASQSNQRWLYHEVTSVSEDLVVFDTVGGSYLTGSSTVEMYIGGFRNIRAAYESDGAVDQSITWTSSNTSVATVKYCRRHNGSQRRNGYDYCKA